MKLVRPTFLLVSLVATGWSHETFATAVQNPFAMVTKPWDESVASGGGTKRSLRGNDKAEAVTQSAVHADKRSIEDSEERGCGLCSKSLVKQLEASPEEAAENFLSLGYEEKRKVFEKIAKSHNPQKLYVLMGGTSLEYDTNAWKFYSAFGKWHDEKYG